MGQWTAKACVGVVITGLLWVAAVCTAIVLAPVWVPLLAIGKAWDWLASCVDDYDRIKLDRIVAASKDSPQ